MDRPRIRDEIERGRAIEAGNNLPRDTMRQHWSNHDALHRHTCHAYEDFRALRRNRDNEALWHSLSHHLRHAVFRSGHEVREPRIKSVRRQHK